MRTPRWLEIAFAELGVSACPPGSSNPRITEYHEGTNIAGYDDKASWCSSFVNWSLAKAGVTGTGSALARSWLEWGTALEEPVVGCIAVLWREQPSSWRGHVGYYLREDEELVYLLGGNQLEQVREHFSKGRSAWLPVAEWASHRPATFRECGLTLRSSGRAPAWRLARAALVHIMHRAGQAPCLRAPLSSNVRPHESNSVLALENRIPPPVVAVLVAAGMWALSRWWPMVRFELPSPILLGLAVASVGGVISGAGAREFRRAKTTVNPLHPERASAVVTTGIYRYTRNPMYVGVVFVLLGCFLAFGGLSAALGLPAFVLYITRYQIQPEEHVLLAKFGKEYADYTSRVRRWL